MGEFYCALVFYGIILLALGIRIGYIIGKKEIK